MKNKQEIENELREISPALVDLQQKNTFVVPAFYFENLANIIIEKINNGQEAKYYFTSKMPYSVSTNYFETLADNLLVKIHLQQNESVEDELQTIAPVLNTISKTPVYKVPTEYFETLTITSNKVKVVKMSVWKKYLTYAVAASVMAVVGIGLFYFTGSNQKTTDTIAVSKQVKNLSEDEILQYISADIPSDNINSTSFDKNSMENDLSKSVKQMTDKEINQYLDELGDKEGI